jgi:hypothetical protein
MDSSGSSEHILSSCEADFVISSNINQNALGDFFHFLCGISNLLGLSSLPDGFFVSFSLLDVISFLLVITFL